MPNGFVVTKADWEHITPAQQSWMTFDAIQSLDRRLKKLEGRKFFNKALSFGGGLIGGALAALGIKIGG